MYPLHVGCVVRLNLHQLLIVCDSETVSGAAEDVGEAIAGAAEDAGEWIAGAAEDAGDFIMDLF